MDQKSRSFRAVGYPLRLHAGADALDALRTEVERQKATRAFVISGRTVATKTDLLDRISANLGPLYAGAFSAMDKDSSWPAVRQAVEAARAAEADLLIALGGGSVIVGTRAVAILLGEKGDAFSLMTQYPEGKPAYSPRLMAPKPPIINVVTTPTTAMNRAGTGLKNEDLDHRMEFFDPKTRPCAIFWDADALADGARDAHPLDRLDRAFQRVARARHGDEPAGRGRPPPGLPPAQHRPAPRRWRSRTTPALRIDLCAAAFLQNRADDDDQGRRRARDRTGSSAYALATALHIRYDHVWQGESTTSVIPAVTRLTPPEDVNVAARIAEGIGVWQEGMSSEAAAAATADALTALYNRIGMPARLRDARHPEGRAAAAGPGHAEELQRQPGRPAGRLTPPACCASSRPRGEPCRCTIRTCSADA